ASGAEPIILPGNHDDRYYIVDDKIIIIDSDWRVDIKKKEDWIWDIDPEDFYPDYDDNWNEEFWEYPSILYHATTDENVEDILRDGLESRSQTRGLSNRSVG